MQLAEIVLPSTKPATEWVRGRALQKVSPKRDHSRVQGELVSLAPPGEARRPLVPDVAFVKYEMLRGLTHDEMQTPEFAPTVAVEVLSPGDDPRDVASKTDVYLRGGSELVIVVDTVSRTMVLHDAGRSVTLSKSDVLLHEALPGFDLPG